MLKEIQRTETIMNLTVEEEDVTKDTSEEEELSLRMTLIKQKKETPQAA